MKDKSPFAQADLKSLEDNEIMMDQDAINDTDETTLIWDMLTNVTANIEDHFKKMELRLLAIEKAEKKTKTLSK